MANNQTPEERLKKRRQDQANIARAHQESTGGLFKVDLFRRDNLSPEEDQELIDLVNSPAVTTLVVQSWLESKGAESISAHAVNRWVKKTKKEGERAKLYNSLLSNYDGADIQRALYPLIVELAGQMENAISVIEGCDILSPESPIHAAEWLRILPALSREVRGCVTELHKMQHIQDIQEIEMSGAMRIAKELRAIFADTAFEEALNEGIRSAMMRIESEL